jgi:Leucine-rich repeat (LRR) protein
MTQDELIIKRFCKDYNVELKKVDSYVWNQQGYVVNSMGRIEALNLHSFKIKKMPKYIAKLSELKILHLVRNELRSIQEIANLTKLEILVIEINKIIDISVVKELKALREFYAQSNPIVDITPLKHLKNLKTISLDCDKIRDFKPICYNPKLHDLRLAKIKKSTNITFLRECKKIESLNLVGDYKDGGVIIEIFDNIKHLDLSTLYIRHINQLDTAKFKCFPELRSLTINSDDIKDISFLSNLTKLEELFLNKITNIQAVSELTKLKKLSVSSSNIEDIHFLSNLTELEELDLSRNEINDIQIISELTKLKKLKLYNNNIKDIGPLKKLKYLKTIDLRNNFITDIEPLLNLNMRFVYEKPSFLHKELENDIIISGCDQITNPPIEIVKQGHKAIVRHFNRIAEEGVDYIYEAKLILVGEGGSGKTSLQRRLLDEKAELPKSDKRTRGIEVVDFEFKEGKIAHIWDFGGQVIYYPVHRFFITGNSVFVLLASTRHNNHNFDYWLPTIFQFGGKSPTIIGQTCHYGHKAPWNDLGIYLCNSNFNIIKTLDIPYYEINLPNENEGLSTIKKCIISQIENLPHFGRGVPKSWLKVRNTLLKKSESASCIPFQSFIDLCSELEPNRFKKMEDIEDCCKFLHDIGIIIWYSEIEELKDWVILKPEWAMNAVYKVIDDENIQKNNGYSSPNDFTRLWNDESYRGKHNILKKILEAFKIAFQTKHSQGNYIIPAKLESMPPEKKWVLEEKSLCLEYKFEFMPKGIVNQLSAELSRYIHDNEVWNNAVNLIYNNNTMSQIIEDSHNRVLNITSKGIDARGINIIIMYSLENIINSYRDVKADIQIKCPCKTCQKSDIPIFFLYGKLIEWSNKNKSTVTCNESGITLNISELLYGVGFGKKGTTNKIIRIFLASSEELKDDRKEFEIFIGQENNELINKGIYIKLEIWEDFINCMSQTRLQDEYNKTAIKSDIFVSLFWKKVGEYTKEEFSKAFGNFKEEKKPLIYTYFNSTPANPDEVERSLADFKEELRKLGHYPTEYKNIDDLKYQFKMQLQKILPSLI